MKKLITCIGALFLLLCLGAVAFAGGQKEKAAPVQAINLDFWSWRTEDTEVYNDLIKMFQKSYPNINIKFSTYKQTDYATILSAAMKGGNAPDIVHLRAYGGLE